MTGAFASSQERSGVAGRWHRGLDTITSPVDRDSACRSSSCPSRAACATLRPAQPGRRDEMACAIAAGRERSRPAPGWHRGPEVPRSRSASACRVEMPFAHGWLQRWESAPAAQHPRNGSPPGAGDRRYGQALRIRPCRPARRDPLSVRRRTPCRQGGMHRHPWAGAGPGRSSGTRGTHGVAVHRPGSVAVSRRGSEGGCGVCGRTPRRRRDATLPPSRRRVRARRRLCAAPSWHRAGPCSPCACGSSCSG